MTDLDEFIPFTQLPLELRRKIWLWTVPRPRVLSCCHAALEHFEFIPKHASNRRVDRHCIGEAHSCNWGYIDFAVDHLARRERMRHQCLDKTLLKNKTQNLHTGEFEWCWAADPTEFRASSWVLRHLLQKYNPSVRRLLLVVHMDKIRQIPPDQRDRIEEQLRAVVDVIEIGLIELKAQKERDLEVQRSLKWKDWTPPKIHYQRCPCSWEQGPIYPAGSVCLQNFFVPE